MKQKIKQILYDLRHQRVISLITLTGTALAVFLLMTVVMLQEVETAPFSPVSQREHIVYSSGIHVKTPEGWDMSGYLNPTIAHELYDNLDGIELVSYYTPFLNNVTVKKSGGNAISSNSRAVDEVFWQIYDFDLKEGRYFTKSEVEADAKVAIISKSLAEKLFGKESPVGEEFTSLSVTYTVIGVVDDVSPLATQAYADFYTPINEASHTQEDKLRGHYRAAMLLADNYPLQKVRDQVKARYAALATRVSADGSNVVYHGSPYDRFDMTSSFGTNTDPEPDSGKTIRYIIYAILLIVPAVNLSSMTHSRMRRRISEIGVRRAFGCTRARIIRDIITENFIITLIGASIGFIACVIFTTSYSSLIFSWDTMGLDSSIPLDALINLKVFGIAIGLCILLNIISASIPAWLASRVNPVEAINARAN